MSLIDASLNSSAGRAKDKNIEFLFDRGTYLFELTFNIF